MPHSSNNDLVSTTDNGATTRRAVLAGVGAAGAAGVLSACGGKSTSGQPAGSQSGGGTPASTGAASGSTGGGQGNDLGKTSDIPVGGGKVFPTQKVVVTQPAAGTFKAFSAICTHMNCTVGSVSGGVITCPCHGSQYSIVDGSVKGGPAPRALAAKTISVANNEILVT
jgi:Rieske Fe-S protein